MSDVTFVPDVTKVSDVTFGFLSCSSVRELQIRYAEANVPNWNYLNKVAIMPTITDAEIP